MEWVKKYSKRPGNIYSNAIWLEELMAPTVPPATWQEWDEFFLTIAMTDPMTFNHTVVERPGNRSACVMYGFASGGDPKRDDSERRVFKAWRYNAVRYAKKHKLGKYSGK